MDPKNSDYNDNNKNIVTGIPDGNINNSRSNIITKQ